MVVTVERGRGKQIGGILGTRTVFLRPVHQLNNTRPVSFMTERNTKA